MEKSTGDLTPERAYLPLPEDESSTISSDQQALEQEYVSTGKPSDGLGHYLHEIRRTPLLSHEEVLELVAMGTPEARGRIIEANLRLVVSIAKQYVGGGLLFQELIAAGNKALIDAVDGYDRTRGYHLSTYASKCVRRAILTALALETGTIRIPGDAQRDLRWAEQRRGDFIAHFSTQNGREPTGLEIEMALGPPLRLLQKVHEAKRILSLEAPLGDEERARTLADEVADPAPTTDVLVEQRVMQEEIQALLATLPPLERAVVSLHFGLGGDREYTYAEIGKKLGLEYTPADIQKIKVRALVALRKNKHLLQSYIE